MPPRDHLPAGEKPLYLIDGASFIYRGFYAMGDLSRSDGFPTNALFIVLRLALRLLREEAPSHAAFVMDGRGPSFRADLFPAYKAQRQKMPEPLAAQIAPIMEGVALLGYPVLRLEGVEADDTIASLAARFKGQRPVVIVGSDKDLRQCLDANVLLWDPAGKQEKIVTLRDFTAEFPPGPAYWPDFQALTGDASDNIPGVPGVGPKTAQEVTASFPSLESLKEGIEELKPALRKKIEPHLEDLFVYRELTRLRTDLAGDMLLEDLAVRPAPLAQVAGFLNAYELRSLAREVQAAGIGREAAGPGMGGGTAAAGAGRGDAATGVASGAAGAAHGRAGLLGSTAGPADGQADKHHTHTGAATAEHSKRGERDSLLSMTTPAGVGVQSSSPSDSAHSGAPGQSSGSRPETQANAAPGATGDAGPVAPALPGDAAGLGRGRPDPTGATGPGEPPGGPMATASVRGGNSLSGQVAMGGGARLSLFAPPPPAREQAPLPEPSLLQDLPSFAGRETAVVPVQGGLLLACEGREWLVASAPGEPPAAGLAPLLAAASRLATPSFKDLLSADPAWQAVPLTVWFDVSLAAYLLNPEERSYTWERMQDGLHADPGFSAEEAPGGAQGLACLALARRQAVRLEQAGLTPLYGGLELPLIPVLVSMERLGLGIDRQAFAAFAAEVNARLEGLAEDMQRLAGVRFNVRSSQQLAEVLFKRLELKPPAKTPGGAASTSAEALERLVGQHAIIEAILEHRKLEKLRSTYLEPLPALAGEAGRIHTTFNQLSTATGRLSSSQPNLQNIPVRGELGRRMRSLFVAGPGMVLASADYSQIELRVLAHFSKDPALTEAFRLGQDIHTRTAALLFERDPAAVTPEERRQAKTINFGLLYGMGAQKLSRELGLTMTQAKEFIARYFERLSVLKGYYQSVVDQARELGFVTTLAGRRRLLPDIRSRNQQLEAQAKRQAVNTVIQGSAADIIKMAMLAVHRDDTLAGLGARLILQVHDELVLEVPQERGRQAGERLAELMTGVVSLDVPVTADLGVGRDWGGAH